MSKEKQIEEIAKIIDDACKSVPVDVCDAEDDCAHCRAKRLYNAGYRKQSEGEWVLTGSFKSTFPLPVAELHEACSVCKWSPPKYSADYKEYNFCPKCGAKMCRAIEVFNEGGSESKALKGERYGTIY